MVPDMQIVFPPGEYCADNAAMIAWTGYEMYQAGYSNGYEMTQRPVWPLNELMAPSVGWKHHKI
jgi:N6-L-threonylcarbamoyladenine synthase